MKIRALLLLRSLAVSIPAATLQIVSGAYGSGKAYVICTIDGAKERCFVDTGSAMTLVPDSKRYASYTNLGALHFKSAADIAQETETIQVGSIQIDDVAFANVKIGRANFQGAEKTLGIDLVGRQPFSISFKPKPALQLNASRPELPLTTLEVSKHGVFSIPINLGDTAVRALWDTGVSLTSVDQAFVTAHPENFTPTKKYLKGFDGAGKPMLLQSFRAKRITIAAQTFRNIRVVAADLSVLRDNWNQDIQAVVGFNLIQKGNWFFDTKNRLWSFER